MVIHFSLFLNTGAWLRLPREGWFRFFRVCVFAYISVFSEVEKSFSPASNESHAMYTVYDAAHTHAYDLAIEKGREKPFYVARKRAEAVFPSLFRFIFYTRWKEKKIESDFGQISKTDLDWAN